MPLYKLAHDRELAHISSPSSDVTLDISSIQEQFLSPTVDISVLLPTTHILTDDVYIIGNRSETKIITLKASNGSVICSVIPKSWVRVVCLSDTPTTSAHWGTIAAGGGWATVTTVTTQGLGTIGTTSIKVRRVGGSLEYEGILTTGITTGLEAQFGIPFGLTTLSTISTLELAGDMITDQIGSTIVFYMLREPSVTYFTFGYNIGTTDAYAKANGNDLNNSSILSFRASTPISGWEIN